MARGVNRVIIIGNLGQDPETKYMPSGNAVTNISVATSEEWKNKETGQKESRTEWHRVTLFNKLGEIAGQYLKKGSKVYIEGSLRTRKWQAQDGSDRYSTEVIASEMQMLDSKNEGSRSTENESSNSRPQTSDQQQPQSGTSSTQGGGGFSDDDFESDQIPF